MAELELTEFLAKAEDFQLGQLLTEQPHPQTTNLSTLAQDSLPAACALLWEVDQAALAKMRLALEPAAKLAAAVASTLNNGGRIFLAGCGATGRLSLALETFARQGMLPEAHQESVIGFMAGGDAALIRSIEGFEDLPDYGARQLAELGFTAKDLLIASTEGGETPWVIGATEAAARLNPDQAPWFCYCNPDSLLRRTVERSRRVLDNPAIEKWNLTVGPMALAGSTRMQASTVLMLGIGLALIEGSQSAERGEADLSTRIHALFEQFVAGFSAIDPSYIAGLTQAEADGYRAGQRIIYQTTDFGLTVLTDTTERAPTFSLAPFENRWAGSDPPSLCYLRVPEAPNVAAAWRSLLGREPRCLEWEECRNFTGRQWLDGYPIAHHDACDSARFSVKIANKGLALSVNDPPLSATQPALFPETHDPAARLLFLNTTLKCLLNLHSTLVMGRLGRYEGNLMTFVKASNRKLIDRAIRYVRILAERENLSVPSYNDTAAALFATLAELRPNEPVVLKSLERLPRK